MRGGEERRGEGRGGEVRVGGEKEDTKGMPAELYCAMKSLPRDPLRRFKVT